MKKSPFFINQYKTIKNKIQKNINASIYTYAGIWGFILSILIIGYGVIMIVIYVDSLFPGIMVNFFLLILIVISIVIIGIGTIFSIYKLVKNLFIFPINIILQKTESHICSLNNSISSGISALQQIDEILDKLENARYLYKFLFIVRGSIYYLSRKNYSELSRIIESNLDWILGILSDLRSDLTLRLTEKQESLESAKSEVEKNIRGTTELEQVSELQKTRLDRQIEQFEELQRMLVKI